MIGSSPTWNRGYQAERFRQDLYYRLNVITIHVPPLRERLQDVPLLAAQLLQTYARENHNAIMAMQQEAIERLMAYDWPGNVRELENVIERAVVLAQGSVITLADLYLEEPPDKAPCHTNDSFVLPAKATLAQIKREAILQALHRSRGHRSPLTYWGSDPVSHVEKNSGCGRKSCCNRGDDDSYGCELPGVMAISLHVCTTTPSHQSACRLAS